jgi:RNA-directed DNA polymerase
VNTAEVAQRSSLRWLSYAIQVPVERIRDLASRADRCYHPFLKVRRGKDRSIDNPNSELKTVQSLIRDNLLAPIPLSDIVHGCVKGRSALTNAMQHVGQRSVSSVDIRKCYPSITNRMVFRFFRDQLKLGPKLAAVLTRLTTKDGHLPTGAPTSDALANLILSPVDHDVVLIAERFGLQKTRFVDNIDFAGPRSREAIGPTIRSLQELGVAVAHRKVFNAGANRPHQVTGYTVNGRRPSLSRKHRDNVRAACHQAIRAHERGESLDEMMPNLRGRLAHVRRTNPQTAERLQGMLLDAGVPRQLLTISRPKRATSPKRSERRHGWEVRVLPEEPPPSNH